MNIEDAPEFEEWQIEECANELVQESLDHLGKGCEDYTGLIQSLLIHASEFEQLIDIYETNRDEWLSIMQARARMFWRDKIQQRLEQQQ
jgi:hypothetical protein